MKLKYFLLITFATLHTLTKAQIARSSYLRIDAPDSTQNILIKSLDTLFQNISIGKPPANLTAGSNSLLTASILTSFKGLEADEKTRQADFYKKQLINCYPLGNNDFSVSVAYIASKPDSLPKLKTIITIIAHIENKAVSYSLPLKHLTRYWKTKKQAILLTTMQTNSIRISLRHLIKRTALSPKI